MRSGAWWNEEQKSEILPCTGPGDRATTQNSSSCARPAPTCSLHINHYMMDTPSNCVLPNLCSCTSYALRLVSVCLVCFCPVHWCHHGTWGTLLPGQDGTDTPASSSSLHCLPHEGTAHLPMSMVLSPLRSTAVLNPWFYIESSDNYTVFISDLLKQCIFLEEGSLTISPIVEHLVVPHTCSSSEPPSPWPSTITFPWWVLFSSATRLKYQTNISSPGLQNFPLHISTQLLVVCISHGISDSWWSRFL